MRAKHAERAQDLLTYKEAYEIANGAASEFNGTRGYSSEDDTRGTRSTISGLRTSLRQAQARLQSRDHLVEDVLERLRTTRNPHRQGASALQDNGGHTKATMDLFSRQMSADRVGGRCDVPTPTKSPISRPCSLREPMPSSVESGVGPSLRGVASGTKRRVEFDIEDVGSASGSKSRKA